MPKYTPVDYDPFAETPTGVPAGAKLTPVDYDPFAKTNDGFFDRLQSNFSERKGQMQGIADQAVAGAISTPEAVVRGGLKLAQIPFDTVGREVLAPAAKGLFNATAAPIVQESVADVGSYLANPPENSLVGNALQGVKNLQERYPVTTGRIGSALDLGNIAAPFAPIFKGESAFNAVVNSGQTAAKGIKQGSALALEQVPAVDRALGKTVRPTAEALKDVSRVNYAKAEELGGNLSGDFTNKFIDHAQSLAKPRSGLAGVTAGENPVADLVSKYSEFRDKPMSLNEATDLDQSLTELLDDPKYTDKNGILNNYGRQVLQIKENLRSGLNEAADSGLVQGGSEGIDAYKTAVKDYAAQAQISDIQRIVDRASYMDNPATALKTGFRNIAVNPGRLSKYPPDVQKAIKNAARDGDIANFARTQIGSRLISTVVGGALGSTGGPLVGLGGAITGAVTGGFARNAAESMQMGRVNKVVDAIAQKSSLPTTQIPLSQLLKMKPAEARKVLKVKK